MKKIYNLSFGVTSAIMTSLAIVIGLSGTSLTAIITALLIIAIADNVSDSFGIHIYKESECANSKEVTQTTSGNFIARVITTGIFILFVIIFPINVAIIFSIIFSVISIMWMSYFISVHQKKNPYTSILRHLTIALVIMILSFLLREIITKF